MNHLLKDKKLSREIFTLAASIFLAGVCSIVYELLISTTSSYFLGDSIKQFSLTIGIYMAAMGLGSFLSRLVKKNVLYFFIQMELLLSFLGGISVPTLFYVYGNHDHYTLYMIGFIVGIGVCIGMEIPFLTLLMKNYYPLKKNISNVLTLDYIGALAATLIFPFILLPLVGTFRSSIIFGLVNVMIAVLVYFAFKDRLERSQRISVKVVIGTTTLILLLVLTFSSFLLKRWESSLYMDRIIYSKQTPYQNIVLTKNKKDVRLFINGNLQFSSTDEYRYHESLIHPAVGLLDRNLNVLVLGGGDGLAVRELLKFSQIETVTLVDLDPEMTLLANQNPHLLELNKGSLEAENVKVVNQDAYVFLAESRRKYDLVYLDLPDPNNVSLSRLYSKEFYRMILGHLTHEGILVTQATSPYFAPKAFWCIKRTIADAGFTHQLPYHTYVPSFGDWGFIMASNGELSVSDIELKAECSFLKEDVLRGLFVFGQDSGEVDTETNSMDHPVLVKYYLDGWKKWQ